MKIAIIGAGPAGIACAIQLKRMGWDADVFERDRLGGLLHNAGIINNYPGFPEGISGSEMINRIKNHAEKYQINIIHEGVEILEFRNECFLLSTSDHEYHYNIIVIASGTNPNTAHWADKFPGKIFYDVKSLRETNGMNISIIGSGDAAFDYALQLHKENNIDIFNRSERIRCLEVLRQDVFGKENIKYHPICALRNIDFQDESLKLTFNCEEKKYSHISDYLIFAAGRKPNRAFIDNYIADNKQDRLRNEGRLYFAGDVCRGDYRQLSIASGDGLRIAMEISKTISN